MADAEIFIGDRRVGPGSPPFIILEVAQSHGGSVDKAHRYIDAAAEAGADAIKFQTHLADAESTLDEPFRVAIKGGFETRLDYWKAMEFSEDDWGALARHCEEAGLVFLSSAFSVAAVRLLDGLGMPAWKVGSGEFASYDLLDAMCESGKPILLSTGMSRWEEIDRAARFLTERGAPIALFQCTSLYPTPFEDTGLNILGELRNRYGCPVGLSDHSGTPYPSIAAFSLGADLAEVHLMLPGDEDMPDAPVSLDLAQAKAMVAARDAIHIMAQRPVDKDEMAERLAEMRGTFSKSLALAEDQPAGTVLTRAMLTSKKPGTGIPAAEIDHVTGRTLVRSVNSNRLLRWEDLQS